MTRWVQSALVRRRKGFTFGNGVSVYGWPILRCVKGAHVHAGRNLVLISESTYSAVGVAHACVIDALQPGATILIGDDVGMSGASVCCASSVTIGDRVMLGADSVITDTDLHPVHIVPRRHETRGVLAAEVVIENDVFVGMRAIILKGVHVGEGAVVGAGAVVTSAVPARSIVAGSPARVVGAVRRGAQRYEK